MSVNTKLKESRISAANENKAEVKQGDKTNPPIKLRCKVH